MQTNCAEIAGTLPDAELIGLAGAVHFRAQAQAREAQAFRRLEGLRHLFGLVEHLKVESDRLGHPVLDGRNLDRAREIQAGGEEIDVEGGLGLEPKCAVQPEPDRAVLRDKLRSCHSCGTISRSAHRGGWPVLGPVQPRRCGRTEPLTARGKGGRRQKASAESSRPEMRGESDFISLISMAEI